MRITFEQMIGLGIALLLVLLCVWLLNRKIKKEVRRYGEKEISLGGGGDSGRRTDDGGGYSGVGGRGESILASESDEFGDEEFDEEPSGLPDFPAEPDESDEQESESDDDADIWDSPAVPLPEPTKPD